MWRFRHRWILLLLYVHVPALLLFGLARGKGVWHSLLEVASIAALAAMASLFRDRRRLSTTCTSMGLMLCSAVLVHLSGGVIEAHFHFFVMVGVVVLYQDWWPFLIAIAFVVLHHGVMGVVSPREVYNHPAAQQHPWTWAGIHGVSILAMSAVGIANWKLNERSQSQLALLAAIVESTDDAVCGWDIDGRINSWNRGAAQLYGYRRDEVIGRPFWFLIPPERTPDAEGLLAQIRRGDRVEQFDTEHVRKDGGRVEVSVTVSAVRSNGGSVVGAATIARDIGDRRRAEALRRQTLSLLEATLESTANGILVVGTDGRISSFNQRFVEMWRLPDAVLAPRTAQALRTFMLDQLLDVDDVLDKVDQLTSQPEAESNDTLHFRDGRKFERVANPQRVEGVVVGRVWSFYDITERTRLESELAEARDTALESSRLKSEFLATMSHEIRTPMNGVIGLTGLLLETSLTETQRQYADGVRGSGEALLTIINDILDFSKIEAGKLELEMVDFNLSEALDEVAGLVAAPARAKGLEFLAYCLPDVPTRLRGDVGRLRQILLNLVSNAVKFTAEGQVVLRAALGQGTTDDQVMVHIEVTDTGIGIAPLAAERLFEPFSQADASTTRRYGGTGLGLAICRRLAEAMSGTIGVDSEPGHGATFWVDIPLGRVEQTPTGPQAAGRPLRSLRVLVVEDNQTNRLILASQLLAWDIHADLAADAFIALDLLRDAAATGRPYEVVLTDMAMPGMDGLELGRIIRSDPELTAARMLLLSSVPVDAGTIAEAGFAARLTKPVRRAQLYDALVRVGTPSAIHLPAAEDDRAAPASRGRLLIVEDNTINQIVAKGMVAKLGYSCDVAANGMEALEAIALRRYDAVLMDCQMPEMDGFEATAEIRHREAGATRVPIVAMTAGALVEDRERCLAVGMDDFLSKPVKSGNLERILDQWIPSADRRRVGRPLS